MSLTFERELEDLINKYSMENGSNTPDFILAKFLLGCLTAWNEGVMAREQWYDRNQKDDETGGSSDVPVRVYGT